MCTDTHVRECVHWGFVGLLLSQLPCPLRDRRTDMRDVPWGCALWFMWCCGLIARIQIAIQHLTTPFQLEHFDRITVCLFQRMCVSMWDTEREREKVCVLYLTGIQIIKVAVINGTSFHHLKFSFISLKMALTPTPWTSLGWHVVQ